MALGRTRGIVPKTLRRRYLPPPPFSGKGYLQSQNASYAAFHAKFDQGTDAADVRRLSPTEPNANHVGKSGHSSLPFLACVCQLAQLEHQFLPELPLVRFDAV